MKILFLTNIPSPYRVAFFRELGKLCELTVLYEKEVATNRNADWKAEESDDTYQSIYLPALITRSDNGFCPKVTSYLKKGVYDRIIVGVYSTPTGMYAIHYMKKHHIPYYISCDGGMIKDDSKWRFKMKQYFLSDAEGYYSSSHVTDEYLCYYGAEKSKIHRYPFTSLYEKDVLDDVVSMEDKLEIRKKLNVEEDFIFVSVGQFIYRKGYDLLLKASEKLPKNVGVYIVGSEPTKEYLELKETLELNNVHFVGFQKKEKLKQYYCMADVFVLPTREDIWGLVINEAMACGLPVITTDKCVAGLELIDGNGLIIETDNVKLLENALQEYSHMLLDSLSVKAKRSLEIVRNYTIEKMAMAIVMDEGM